MSHSDNPISCCIDSILQIPCWWCYSASSPFAHTLIHLLLMKRIHSDLHFARNTMCNFLISTTITWFFIQLFICTSLNLIYWKCFTWIVTSSRNVKSALALMQKFLSWIFLLSHLMHSSDCEKRYIKLFGKKKLRKEAYLTSKDSFLILNFKKMKPRSTFSAKFNKHGSPFFLSFLSHQERIKKNSHEWHQRTC